MLPLKLSIENFCGHSNSEINFNEFSSAVIIGKGKKNLRSSNGVGKSTIFTAIKYAFFNEIDFSALDKVIRHDCESCKVILEFEADSCDIYKISRSRSKTSGSDLRFFKKNADTWDDITARKATETEKEIAKVLKINYKTFCNSVLFSQNDLYGGGLAALTPSDRKKALKEVLQLNIYSALEKLAKNKITDLSKNIEKSKTILATIGDPIKDIIEIDLQLIETENSLKEKQELLNLNKENLDKNNKSLSELKVKFEILEKNNSEFSEKYKIIQNEILNISTIIDEYEKKSLILKKDGIKFNTEIAEITLKLKSLLNLNINIDNINSELKFVAENLVYKKITQKNLELKIKELSVKPPDEAICQYCRQAVSEDHRISCIKNIQKEKLAAITEKNVIDSEIPDLQIKEKVLLQEKNNYDKKENDISKFKQTLEFKEREIKNRRELFSEYTSLIEKNKTVLSIKNENLNILKQSKNNLDEYKNIKIEINNLINIINELTIKTNNYNIEISDLSNIKAVASHKKEQRTQDILKIEVIKKEIKLGEASFALHQKVVDAFGSAGIPTLITHTILDDFQTESNRFLMQLWPGLQTQFSIIKDRVDGDKNDTLDINYILGGKELEYAQLSGAQKLIASLSLKLGLANVIKNRLGTNIKLLLIDEVDQSLDDDMLDAFEESIKKLQKEFKILVITHNKEMKEKFTHAILVEQDENLVSTAKVVNSW